MTVTGRSAYTLKKCGCTQPRRPSHTTCQDRRVSQSSVVRIVCRCLGLKFLKRCQVQELNEANRHALITADLWSPNSHDLSPVNYIWSITQQRVWLMCSLEWNRALLTMSLHDQWRRHVLVCVWATRGHFEYSPWLKLVKAWSTVIAVMHDPCNLKCSTSNCSRMTSL